MGKEKFYIPIDDAKKNFLNHIKANSRTILSSRFGDGKSYFLKELKKDEKAAEEFEFLTLYPVNYQVASNQDIFELIKRDILFQLMTHKMISNRVIVPNDVALQFFVFNDGIGLAQSLLTYVAEVALQPKDSVKVMLAFKGLKLFKDLKEKFEKFKKDFNVEDKIEKFLDKVDNHYIYEEDIVTCLIKRSIDDYKQRTGKKVALFIEDLDRIDPAHLFRILNVFSAHMDYCYKCEDQPDDTLIGNKFNLDNVVMVTDYSNMKKIFHHFYGELTDFSGYISKFTSSLPFYYSLEAERKKYIIKEISRITEAPATVVETLIPIDNTESMSLRTIVNSFKIEHQIIVRPYYLHDERKIYLNTSLLKIFAVLQRMNISQEEIKNSIVKLYQADIRLFITYAAPYVFLRKDSFHDGLNGFVILGDEDGNLRRQDITLNPDTGTCNAGSRYMNIERTGTNLITLCEEMLQYIAK